MIDLNIKDDGQNVTAEYLLKTNDRIDNLTLGMMVNNKIDGVIEVTPVQVESDRYFRYDITGLVTMKKYLGECVKRDRILKVFYGIATTIRESTEYMINWTSFSLDKKEIYVEEETGKVKLICLPLLSVVNDGNVCNFFKNVLFSSQFDLDENGDYVGKLITFLNPKTYTLEKFIFELEEMLEIEHPVKEEIEEDEEEEEVIEEKSEDTESVVEPVEEGESTEETEAEKTESTEETEAEKAESTEESEAEKAESTEESEAEKTESAEETETEKTESAEESEAEKEDVKETLANSDSEETIMMDIPEVIPEAERPEVAPFMIKLRNNQKVRIDKDTFYIGKDDSNVDYCIAGNSAVDEKHAYIIRHGKEYFVVDNNSKNHTYLNRVLIPADEEVFLPHGAHLRFADEDFEFKMHE